MLSFALIQNRLRLRNTGIAVGLLAVLLVVTGLQLRHWYNTLGLADCSKHLACGAVQVAFTGHFTLIQIVVGKIVMLTAPALLGAFWGAPLIARELETGTFRLAWTQSVSPVRWLAGVTAVVVGGGIAVAAALTALTTWWLGPLNAVSGTRFMSPEFDAQGLVPIGYSAFALALGVLSGLLWRRVLPAMATTVGVFLAVRVAVTHWVRPHLGPLHTATGTLSSSREGSAGIVTQMVGLKIPNGAWVINSQLVGGSGRPLGGTAFLPGDPCLTTQSCFNGYHEVTLFHPAAQFWPFQWLETGLYLGAAVLLLAAAFWWVRTRLG